MAPTSLVSQQLVRTAASAPGSAAAARAAIVRTMVQRQQQQQTRGYATPRGPPPRDFRLSKRVEWHWDRDSTLDKMGKFFLLSEMARGMYVLLEQFFRPP